MLLATGFLSYCGPYNQEFRARLIKCWMRILKTYMIPFTENLNITNMLVDTATVTVLSLGTGILVIQKVFIKIYILGI